MGLHIGPYRVGAQANRSGDGTNILGSSLPLLGLLRHPSECSPVTIVRARWFAQRRRLTDTLQKATPFCRERHLNTPSTGYHRMKSAPQNPYNLPLGEKRKHLKNFAATARSKASQEWRDKSTRDHRKIAIAMWLRSVESCEATDLLASREMYGAAWATLRLAYECLFYSCAVLNTPEGSEKLGNHHIHQIAKLLKSQINDKTKNSEQTEEQRNAIASFDDTMRKYQNWPIFEAAKEAGMFDEYSEVYRSISQLGAHANIASLDQHISDVKDQLLTRGGRPGDKDSQIDLSIACLTSGLQRFELANQTKNETHPMTPKP